MSKNKNLFLTCSRLTYAKVGSANKQFDRIKSQCLTSHDNLTKAIYHLKVAEEKVVVCARELHVRKALAAAIKTDVDAEKAMKAKTQDIKLLEYNLQQQIRAQKAELQAQKEQIKSQRIQTIQMNMKQLGPPPPKRRRTEPLLAIEDNEEDLESKFNQLMDNDKMLFD